MTDFLLQGEKFRQQMAFLDKYLIDKESAEDKMNRVSYEKQRQDYELIIDYPRFLINDLLTVWDSKLHREDNPPINEKLKRKNRNSISGSDVVAQQTNNDKNQLFTINSQTPNGKIDPPERLNSDKKMKELRNQFIVVKPKLKGIIDYEGLRIFKIVHRGQIARESDFNIDAGLSEPSNRTGSVAMLPNPDTLLKEVGEEAPKEYVSILQQKDGEQNPSQAIPIEDATQQ
ncbi:MAG: hypothetical protein EZS28_029507, partial [Streblomastix strix]